MATANHPASDKGLGDTVASHYNNIQDCGVTGRTQSKIFHLRNFNNWIKSMLINQFISKYKSASEPRARLNVLDICCGKGGDLIKWEKAGIESVVMCDIAEKSVKEDAYKRYCQRRSRARGRRFFTAEFITADCTKQRLLDLYSSKDCWFDIVSCQFAFHYCFESLEQADCMLRNVAERLKPGGFFIGTMPDAYDLVNRVLSSKSNSFGNEIFSVTFDQKMLDDHVSGAKPMPLFGAQYQFHLDGVVDCPEFLVHFPTMVALAEKHKLMLVSKRSFERYFMEWKDKEHDLMMSMKALERYPPIQSRAGSGGESSSLQKNYNHCEEFLKAQPSGTSVASISQQEWEALTIYQIFAFKKMAD